MNDNDTLTRNQERAIGILLSEPTLAAASKKAGVSELTLYRWMKQPGFFTAYRAACRMVVDTAIGTLQAACIKAVNTLRDIMLDTKAPASSRVTAARAVLESALKALELQDLEERIEALEEVKVESVRERMEADLQTTAERMEQTTRRVIPVGSA